MRHSPNLLGAIVLALCAAAAANARADPTPVNTNGGAFAIGGYDVVAYFADGRATRGDAAHESRYLGTVWLFASQVHKAMFEREPERYLPAYRGYCAYGVARGSLVKIDPQAFTIHRGRLYLNYSLEIRTRWLVDPDAYIRQADLNWPHLSKQRR